MGKHLGTEKRNGYHSDDDDTYKIKQINIQSRKFKRWKRQIYVSDEELESSKHCYSWAFGADPPILSI